MKKKNHFFVIYLDEEIRRLVDGMRIIADPLQSSCAHITVKGPYKTIQKKQLENDNRLIEGKDITVKGVGNFFEENQNTVFLQCEEKEELYNIWKSKTKRTYKEYHPHVTIYDGKDRTFAEQIYNTIGAYHLNFCFVVTGLNVYSSTKAQLFNLKTETTYSQISDWAGIPIDENNIERLTSDQRIAAINNLCTELSRKIANRRTFMSTPVKITTTEDDPLFYHKRGAKKLSAAKVVNNCAAEPDYNLQLVFPT